MTSLHEPPLFAALKHSERILVAGAGGGFDVYAGLPPCQGLVPIRPALNRIVDCYVKSVLCPRIRRTEGMPVSLLERWREHVLALYRVVVGLLFTCHGLSSMFGILGGNLGKGGTIPAGTWPGWWAALIQLIAGALVLVGLGTRGAALLASGSMAYAYFTVHQERAVFPIQNGGEASAMFCWAFLLIVFFGPGSWSVGRLFSRRQDRPAQMTLAAEVN